MTKVIPTENGLSFKCPGCGGTHEVLTTTRKWCFSGTPEKPSFMPAIFDGDGDKKICHSLVTDGKIRFLSDSTHQLSGKEVELPDLELASN